MTPREEVTREEIDHIVEDVSYLQNEAEALKYVIEDVPYNESPPDGKSIAELLLFIDHAQISYFRPIIEDALNNPRPTRINDFEHFEEDFESVLKKAEDIQKVLNNIVKHRAGLLNIVKTISVIDWNKELYKDNTKSTLYDFVRKMIFTERKMLKRIADLVMVFNQEKLTRRNMQNRLEDGSASN